MNLQPSLINPAKWILDGVELETGDTIAVDYFNLWYLAKIEFDEERNIYVLIMPWGTMAIDGQRAYRI